MYHDYSMDNEYMILDIYKNPKPVITPLTNYLWALDSPEFCSMIDRFYESNFQTFKTKFQEIEDITATASTEYHCLVSLIYEACKAAALGDIKRLRELESKTDFNLPDYDKRTPLHYAVRYNQTGVIEYLLKEGKATLDNIDRWGLRVLDYTPLNSSLYSLLVNHRASSKKEGNHTASERQALPSLDKFVPMSEYEV
jgi:hypothetical protein